MRTRMFSPLLLVAGLILGLLAMWAGASPVGATGDLVTGGWDHCWFTATGDWGGASPCLGSCPECGGDFPASCGAGNCGGGTIMIISCSSGAQGRVAGGATPCSGCPNYHSHTCY